MAELNPLLEATLRKDPAKEKYRKAAEIRNFLESRGAERTAKLGESTGLGDLFTFMPAAGALKALKAGQKGMAAVNALAFTSQFDDSPLGQTVGDAMAFMPIFGMGSTKGLARAQERLRKMTELGKKGDLPRFSYEGKMSPGRQKEVEGGIRTWIDKMSDAKDTGKLHRDLDAWIENAGKGWGKKPLEKEKILHSLPSALKPGLNQWAKERGYGGIEYGRRFKAVTEASGLPLTKKLQAERGYSVPSKTTGREVPAYSNRPFEEINKFEMGGGIPKKWEEAFKRQQAAERAKAGMEMIGTGAVSSAAINSLSPSRAESGDSKAGLIVNSRNIGRLQKEMAARKRVLDLRRPDRGDLNEIEAAFAAKYPKLYENGLAGLGNAEFSSGKAGSGSFNPATGGIELEAPGKVGSRDERSAIAKALSHEVLHANDFQRIGKINEPFTRNRIKGSEFVPIGSKPETHKDILDRMEIFNPAEAQKSRFAGQDYITPQVAKDLYSGTSNAQAKAAARYRGQPVEQRAIMAGDTGRKGVDKLLDFTETSGTGQDLDKLLQTHKPQKTRWDELLEKVGLLR